MTIGEVNGTIEHQNASGRPDSPCCKFRHIMQKIIKIVTGAINCWVSSWLSTAEPIAANMDAYNI